MGNVAFLRTRIEFIESFFAPDEVDEIWITFPDPQLRKNRIKKRLTSPQFLEMYARFLREGGKIHLKTDSRPLHDYTKQLAELNHLAIEAANADIYGTGFADEVLSIRTTYEQRFLQEGLPITYLRFRLDQQKTVRTAAPSRRRRSIDGGKHASPIRKSATLPDVQKKSSIFRIFGDRVKFHRYGPFRKRDLASRKRLP